MAADGPLTKPPPPTLLRRPRPPKALTTPLALKTPTSDKPSLHKSTCSCSHQSTTSPSTQNTNTKTDFTIHPLHPKGPHFFPPGKKFVVRHGVPVFLPPLYTSTAASNGADSAPESVQREDTNHHFMANEMKDEWDDEGDFTLSDFQVTAIAPPQRRIFSQQKTRIISRQNYLKLTSWFAVNVPSQASVHTVDMEPAATGLLVSPCGRKPIHQSLLGT